VRTSNPSSGNVQGLILENGSSVFEEVAKMVNNWGDKDRGKYGYSSIGAVVGATYPVEAGKLRTIMSKCFFLVPGFGAQGATADDLNHASIMMVWEQ
jgi:orotidine-5'-phosphate decarboxylase